MSLAPCHSERFIHWGRSWYFTIWNCVHCTATVHHQSCPVLCCWMWIYEFNYNKAEAGEAGKLVQHLGHNLISRLQINLVYSQVSLIPNNFFIKFTYSCLLDKVFLSLPFVFKDSLNSQNSTSRIEVINIGFKKNVISVLSVTWVSSLVSWMSRTESNQKLF